MHGKSKSYCAIQEPMNFFCCFSDKKDGSSRFWVDYRKINEIIKQDSYLLPRIYNTLGSLVINLIFHHRQEDILATPSCSERKQRSFFANTGLCQFNVMSFGLRNAVSDIWTTNGKSSTWIHKRGMYAVLRWRFHIWKNICGILGEYNQIWKKTIAEHLENIKEVLDLLRRAYQYFVKLDLMYRRYY